MELLGVAPSKKADSFSQQPLAANSSSARAGICCPPCVSLVSQLILILQEMYVVGFPSLKKKGLVQTVRRVSASLLAVRTGVVDVLSI